MEEIRLTPHIEHPFYQHLFSGNKIFGIQPLVCSSLEKQSFIIYLNLEFPRHLLSGVRGKAKVFCLIEILGDYTPQAEELADFDKTGLEMQVLLKGKFPADMDLLSYDKGIKVTRLSTRLKDRGLFRNVHSDQIWPGKGIRIVGDII